MTIVTNAHPTYSSNSIKEDLQDVIYTVEAKSTPLLNMAETVNLGSTFHEWQVDELGARASNAYEEGDDTAATAVEATTRVTNRTQISKKVFSVTGTNQAVENAGMGSPLDYQLVKQGSELMREIEFSALVNQAARAASNGTAPLSRGLPSFIRNNDNVASSDGDSETDGHNVVTARTEGTQRDLTEDMLKDVLKQCAEDGSRPSKIMVGAHNKQVISGFSGNSVTRNVDAAGKSLETAIDIYVGDFGALEVVFNEQMTSETGGRARDLYVINPDFIQFGYLRRMFDEPLAKTGDADRHHIVAEWSLIVNNEKAHGGVFDLTTA